MSAALTAAGRAIHRQFLLTRLRRKYGGMADFLIRMAESPRQTEATLWRASVALTAAFLPHLGPRWLVDASMTMEPSAWAGRDMTIYLAPRSAD